MRFIWHKSSNFLSLEPITQVYGVCFDGKGNILIISNIKTRAQRRSRCSHWREFNDWLLRSCFRQICDLPT